MNHLLNFKNKTMFKTNPNNYTSLNKTPWAGNHLATRKKANLHEYEFPDKVGEFWEISTCSEMPSCLNMENNLLLVNTLKEKKIINNTGQINLLLKWIDAGENLSIQIHPNHDNEYLKDNECGKSEAWLIMYNEPNAKIYLGFKDNLTQEEIITAIQQNNVEMCMNSFEVKKYDYIKIPCGMLHAIGRGISLIEIQELLPNKTAVTWRMSDWGRKYNSKGDYDINGTLRDLHIIQSISAINWTLPRAQKNYNELIHNIKNIKNQEIYPDKYTKFFVKFIDNQHIVKFKPFDNAKYLLSTVFSNNNNSYAKIKLIHNTEEIILRYGESALLTEIQTEYLIELNNNAEIIFFAFQE